MSNGDEAAAAAAGSRGNDAGVGGRGGLSSLLDELRSTRPSSSSSATTARIAPASGDGKAVAPGGGGLGMAFVTYNNTSTSATIGRPVVDVHAAAPPAAAAAPPRTSADAPVVPPSSSSSAPPPPPPRFLRATGSAPRPALLGADAGTPRDPYVPKSRADVDGHDDDDGIGNARSGGGGVSHKSRKQVREEERALRSGRAFDGSRAAPSASATEMYQPSPTEFAPTAHAAAIASRAARFRGAAASSSSSSLGGGGEPGPGRGVAMYDPRSGTDVAGLGVTGKHRSKHQINQLMASAISLEAHRASEAELARFGAGAGGGGGRGGSARTDAKRKYGW